MKLGPYTTGPTKSKHLGIYTGDAQQLIKDIPDASVDLALLDPPWGIEYPYDALYDDDPDTYAALIQWTVQEIDRILKPGMFAFVYQALKRLRLTWQLFPAHSRIFAACKNFVQLKNLPVEYAFDPIVFWQKPGKFTAGRGMVRDWHVAQTSKTTHQRVRPKEHSPAPPRPLDTIIYIVTEMCPEDGLVVDFFIGTGTTAVAAKLTGRRWLGFEIVPEAAQYARQRVAETKCPTT